MAGLVPQLTVIRLSGGDALIEVTRLVIEVMNPVEILPVRPASRVSHQAFGQLMRRSRPAVELAGGAGEPVVRSAAAGVTLLAVVTGLPVLVPRPVRAELRQRGVPVIPAGPADVRVVEPDHAVQD